MARYHYDAEAREEKIIQLIGARSEAIEHDILIGRISTTVAVLERLELDNDDVDARLVLWAAVIGGSCAVGLTNAAAVQSAIFEEAQALAERDVADMERHRAEESVAERAMRWLWERGVLA